MEGRRSEEEEAIDVVAAGASGSQALDERTSAMAAASMTPRAEAPAVQMLPQNPTSPTLRRANRPANLDLSLTISNAGSVPPSQPSPAPTLMTLRHALAASPPISQRGSIPTLGSLAAQMARAPGTPDADVSENEEVEATTPTAERISLAQALFESRLPDVPPAGSRRPQQPILIGSDSVASGGEEPPASPRSSLAGSYQTSARSLGAGSSSRRRRRWSVLDGIFPGPSGSTLSGVNSVQEAHTDTEREPPASAESMETTTAVRSSPGQHQRPRMQRPGSASAISHNLPIAAPPRGMVSASAEILPLPPAPSHSHSRLLSRFLNSALNPRRSDDNAAAVALRATSSEQSGGKASISALQASAPAPKLEYVKLPGTKGAVMIKAVETAKKR